MLDRSQVDEFAGKFGYFDNSKAKRELGWQPIWPSWRDGFRRGLSTPVPAPKIAQPTRRTVPA